MTFISIEHIIGIVSFLIIWIVLRYWRKARSQPNWNSLVVVLTGGTHGVGRETAELLLAKSPTLRLIIIDRETPDAEWIASWNITTPHRIDKFITDLSSGYASGGVSAQASSINQLVKEIIAKHGVPDIVINNAGTVTGKYLSELTPEQIGHTLSVNLIAPILITRAFLPHFIERNRGHFIHIASAAGLVGLAWLSDYCASKFALIGFNESLRQELRYTSVKTSTICPGHIKTRLFANYQGTLPLIAPSLHPNEVAQKVINVLSHNVSVDIWIPKFIWTSLFVRAVPLWINDLAHWIVSANNYLPESEAPPYGRRSWRKKSV